MALPIWFVAISIYHVRFDMATTEPGGDAVLYARAARAWLAGNDPWAAAVAQFHFSNPPPTIIAFVPFALIPEQVVATIWLVVSIAAAVLIVRSLHLPLWWLAFPPLIEAVYVGNPHLLALALLVWGKPLGEGVAAVLKVYAVIPVALRLRWRGLLATAVCLAATVAIAPGLWRQYLDQFASISGRISVEAVGGFSATWIPELLVVPTALCLVALWIRDREKAAWLLVPALWPATQFFYATMAMPVAVPWLAALLAIPHRGVAPLAISAFAIVTVLRRPARPTEPAEAPRLPVNAR